MYDLDRRVVRASIPAFRDGTTGAVHLAPVDGHRLELFSGWRTATAPKDGSRYSLDPADWLRHVCSVVGRDLSHEEWNRYLPDRPYRATCSEPAGR